MLSEWHARESPPRALPLGRPEGDVLGAQVPLRLESLTVEACAGVTLASVNAKEPIESGTVLNGEILPVEGESDLVALFFTLPDGTRARAAVGTTIDFRRSDLPALVSAQREFALHFYIPSRGTPARRRFRLRKA